MKTRDVRSVLAVGLTFVLLTAATAAAQENDGRVLRVYKARFLEGHSAMVLAVQVCGGDNERCGVEPLSDNEFALTASPQLHMEFEMLLRERDVPPATQEFRVILLAADDSGDIPELPEGARQALEDIRTVTPYTGFSLIDSGWLRTSSHASTTLGPMGSFSVQVEFEGDPRADGALLVRRFNLAHRPLIQTGTVGAPERMEDIPAVRLGDQRQLIGSSFGIHVGETVVVGTSRINGGDQALVVLLTALDR